MTENTAASPKKPEKPAERKAPFAKGAKLRFCGTRSLRSGYNLQPILEPGTVVTIAEVVGDYSLYSLGEHARFLLAIRAEEKLDWQLLP